MSFDFYARYGLFTYAQSAELCHWAILDHFTTIGAECIIGKELHADGGTHLHVFADWGRRKRFRRADFADVLDHHPNIVPSRGTPSGGWDYATKDGDIVAGGLGRPDDTSVAPKDEKWHRILDASTRDEYFELLRDLAPADLAKSFPSLLRYADHRYALREPTYDGPVRGDGRFDLSAYPELLEWSERLDNEPGNSSRKFFSYTLASALWAEQCHTRVSD